MKSVTEELLKLVSNWKDGFKGAFNIREDGGCAGRQSTEHIQIDSKKDLPGLDIHIQPGTKGETVSIPACVTHGDVDDLVYNDFYIGDAADIEIIAGCGVHTDDGHGGRHNVGRLHAYAPAVVHGVFDLGEHLFGQTFAHHILAEYVRTENIRDSHFVTCLSGFSCRFMQRL